MEDKFNFSFSLKPCERCELPFPMFQDIEHFITFECMRALTSVHVCGMYILGLSGLMSSDVLSFLG